MSISALKKLRFFAPGVIAALGYFILGEFTGWWSQPDELSFEDLPKILPVFVVGVIYYVTPLRDRSNRKYFERVSENIRQGLYRIYGRDDINPEDWARVRVVFFQLIDSDESLREKAKIAYFNGAIWTTVADVRIISWIYAVISLVLFVLLGNTGALLAFISFSAISLVTYPISNELTKKHMEIGDEQLTLIESTHKIRLVKKLDALHGRENTAGT
ncbi:hypothetical protein [Rhodosalinus sp. K401]|uniref:hypothetical protein n=1 Tax=Rhodosalinus sp. K401 TaxID=3239195 RepID=UPI003523EEF4